MNFRNEHSQANLIEPELMFRLRDDGPTRPDKSRSSDAFDASDVADTARLPAGEGDSESADLVPKITQLPEGIEVVEQSVGRAVGSWILQVRCQCGRRWFEATSVDATHCPRCGMYVYIDFVAGDGPKT